MKKLIPLLLIICICMTLGGCGQETTQAPYNSETPAPTPESPLPEGDSEPIKTADLGEYTIVYPSAYEDWQLTEVNLLKATIEHLTGKTVKTAKDSESAGEKEIIFASSERETGFSDYVSKLESRLDYVIGVDDGKIVIGGQDYYGDMRAAYRFINDYLGYDDVDNEYSEAQTEVSGADVFIYEKPKFRIAAGNFYLVPYTEAWQVRDVRDANFNSFIVQGLIFSYDTMEAFRQVVLWCTRFDLELILPMSVDYDTVSFTLQYEEAYSDNPIVWGHYITDEPTAEKIAPLYEISKQYYDKYSSKGWKSFINYCGSVFFRKNEEIMDYTDVISYDNYFGQGSRKAYPSKLDGMGSIVNVFQYYDRYQAASSVQGKELWSFVGTYYLENFNTSKMIRWIEYIPLCFNVKALEYFNYQVWIVDGNFNKLPYYYDAQQANKEAQFIGDTLADGYEYLGAYFLNKAYNETVDDIIDGRLYSFPTIEEFIPSEDSQSTILVGAYEREDGGKAILIVNVDELDYVDYKDTKASPSRIKINGDNVKFYREGVEYNVEKDADGCYLLEIGNGHCWFVTVD